MKRLLVNDIKSAIPGSKTFWDDLIEWFDCEFVGAPYDKLVVVADAFGSMVDDPGAQTCPLIIRNATYFGPLESSKTVPTISLLQDIITEGPQREMQIKVIASSSATVFNSAFTFSKYSELSDSEKIHFQYKVIDRVIPLPVDFDLFTPGNVMGLQQALALPDGAVCWIGACQGAAGQVKGFDIFLSIVRQNPDIPFVGVFKDALPEYAPANLRMYVRLTHEELVKVIGACRVGLCTSRTESQHLAGIEMGACGLPVVAPPVGCYYGRENDFPGFVMKEGTEPEHYATALRLNMSQEINRDMVRSYWRKEFDKPVIRAAWSALIEEVESPGRWDSDLSPDAWATQSVTIKGESNATVRDRDSGEADGEGKEGGGDGETGTGPEASRREV